jgi:hypothetical protein
MLSRLFRGISRAVFQLCPSLVVGTAAAASLGMPGDSDGTIAAARQRMQLRQRVRHSDREGAIAYTGARLASPHPAALVTFMWLCD